MSYRGLVLAAVVLSPSAMAQDVPSIGLLYNTVEGQSLNYRCQVNGSERLSCEFVQTAVRKKATAKDLAASIQAAQVQFKSEKPHNADECRTYREVLAVLEGRKAAPKAEAMSNLSKVERADAVITAKSLIDYCTKPTEANLVAIVKLSHDKDSRTCSSSSNSYKQTFRRVSDSGTRPVWVAETSPEGPCGIVQLSRFEPEELSLGSSKSVFWKYIARKSITNPNGQLVPGMQCKSLDESSYTYDWRAKEHQLTCDYVVFSPI